MTKFLNISTDNTLGGNSSSNEKVASQKAVKDYVDSHSGGSVDVDNKSITQNSSDELQTVGVIDQNATTTAIKTWTGTRTQYNALVSGGTVDNNTLYNITDDSDVALNLLQTVVYPVGSIYIGTMAVCPLSAVFGTWELVAGGRVLQGSDSNHLANTTIEPGLPNITGSFTKDDWPTPNTSTGSFYNTSATLTGRASNVGTGTTDYMVNFDASRSSSIYGNSNTVQPPAFVVNIWKRTA